jgi:hypothetical protein
MIIVAVVVLGVAVTVSSSGSPALGLQKGQPGGTTVAAVSQVQTAIKRVS